MKIVKFITLSVAGLLALGSVAAYRGQIRISAAATHRKAGAVVDADGSLRVPAHYRTSYQFLGSWAIAADKGRGSKALHVVYASPGTIAAYQRTGRFPDGSVLVKEVYQTATQPMATGTVSHAEKLQGWFVMVKESKDIHPNNKLWGEGWAWSWFDAGNPSKTTSTTYRKDCLPCHRPARATDLVYVVGYPPLHSVK
jgi:hypothetical protein